MQDDELRRENQALRERLSALSQASLRINRKPGLPGGAPGSPGLGPLPDRRQRRGDDPAGRRGTGAALPVVGADPGPGRGAVAHAGRPAESWKP